jgi:branched-chain amino acid transport system permease protein
VILVWLSDRLSVAGFTLVGLITGTIFVVVVLAFRRGIWGTLRALLHRERNRRR